MLRTRFTAAFPSISVIFIFFFLIGITECSDDASQVAFSSQQATCSKQCVAKNCLTLGIRYGKYCGVGWFGCPGEEPCDDLDACCMVHDHCVTKKGMTNVECHKEFQSCVRKVEKSGKSGFSKECPSVIAAPIMEHGMNLGILLSHLGNSRLVDPARFRISDHP